jgi:signal-transduction protein with cAMP-binding, CBS, and nucleotidyltransferase domain
VVFPQSRRGTDPMAPAARRRSVGAMTVPIASDATTPSDRLETPVRSIMRPGVISVSDDASLLQAKRALMRHHVHAILVVSHAGGQPLGWVTDRGLLNWLDHDLALVSAGQAITEPATFIEPGATAREALAALMTPGVSHLLVARTPGTPPHGVVAPLDLVELVSGEHR